MSLQYVAKQLLITALMQTWNIRLYEDSQVTIPVTKTQLVLRWPFDHAQFEISLSIESGINAFTARFRPFAVSSANITINHKSYCQKLNSAFRCISVTDSIGLKLL